MKACHQINSIQESGASVHHFQPFFALISCKLKNWRTCWEAHVEPLSFCKHNEPFPWLQGHHQNDKWFVLGVLVVADVNLPICQHWFTGSQYENHQPQRLPVLGPFIFLPKYRDLTRSDYTFGPSLSRDGVSLCMIFLHHGICSLYQLVMFTERLETSSNSSAQGCRPLTCPNPHEARSSCKQRLWNSAIGKEDYETCRQKRLGHKHVPA